MRLVVVLSCFLLGLLVFGQGRQSPDALKIDTSFAYFQYHNPDLGAKFLRHFENIANEYR